MVLCVKASSKEAQRVKSRLVKKGLIDKRYPLLKEDDLLFFPVLSKEGLDGLVVVEMDLEPIDVRPTNLKDALEGKLPDDLFDDLKTSFDVVGTIAILEIPDELEPYQDIIGKSLLGLNNNIKTVVRKEGKHEGVFRTQKMVHLAGKRTTETIHRENGVRLKLESSS